MIAEQIQKRLESRKEPGRWRIALGGAHTNSWRLKKQTNKQTTTTNLEMFQEQSRSKNEEPELVGKMRNTDITEEPQNCSCHMGMATSLDFFLSEMDIQ